MKSLPASDLDAVLLASPKGIPVKPQTSQATEMTINTTIAARLHPPVKILNRIWFNPKDGTALGRIRLRRGEDDFKKIHAIINDAAIAYKGVIPDDRWHEPYMTIEELQHEIDDGVAFWGYEEGDELVGVMGIQDVQDVTLIRHSYVRTADRGRALEANC